MVVGSLLTHAPNIFSAGYEFEGGKQRPNRNRIRLLEVVSNRDKVIEADQGTRQRRRLSHPRRLRGRRMKTQVAPQLRAALRVAFIGDGAARGCARGDAECHLALQGIDESLSAK
jgi:hypothetical protein